MHFTLNYVKQRLLNAGQHLQRAIIDESMNDPDLFKLVHDAQNQLALALASVVQMEADEPASINEQRASIEPGELVSYLIAESRRTRGLSPHLKNIRYYTTDERQVLADAVVIIERNNPEHLGTELDNSCG